MAGIVAEENPYDKLQLTATIGSSDPLFQQKRALLQRHNLATQQSFDIYVDRVRSLTITRIADNGGQASGGIQ